MATLKPLEDTLDLACQGPGPMVVPLPVTVAPPPKAPADPDDDPQHDLPDDERAARDLLAGLKLLAPATFGNNAHWRHQRARLAAGVLQMQQVRRLALEPSGTQSPVPAPVPAPPPAPDDHGACEDLKHLSPAAFDWMARVNDIGVFLYDRRFVDARSIAAKLEGEAGKLASDLQQALRQAGLAEAATRLGVAVAVEPFKSWVGQDVQAAALEAELHERVLALLQLQCWLAVHVIDLEPVPAPGPQTVPAEAAPAAAVVRDPRKAGQRRRA